MVLKFLTDENIATSLIKALRVKGYDVKDIKEENWFGMDDEIVRKARDEKRVILTHDKDFANLWNHPLENHPPTILIRYKNQSPRYVISKFIPLVDEIVSNIENMLMIVTDDFIKIYKS